MADDPATLAGEEPSEQPPLLEDEQDMEIGGSAGDPPLRPEDD